MTYIYFSFSSHFSSMSSSWLVGKQSISLTSQHCQKMNSGPQLCVPSERQRRHKEQKIWNLSHMNVQISLILFCNLLVTNHHYLVWRGNDKARERKKKTDRKTVRERQRKIHYVFMQILLHFLFDCRLVCFIHSHFLVSWLHVIVFMKPSLFATSELHL